MLLLKRTLLTSLNKLTNNYTRFLTFIQTIKDKKQQLQILLKHYYHRNDKTTTLS